VADSEEHLWDVLGAPGENVPRLLHSGEEWNGQPYVYVDDSGIDLVAGTSERPDQGISVNSDYGTQVTGPFSMSDMPQNIAVANGYYRLNPALLACIGSSSALPIPTLVWGTPKILQSKNDMSALGKGLGI
jgi:hypothetical protein